MIKFEYKKGDLFKNLHKEYIHLHANNSYGNWGAGIAKKFAVRFPKSYFYHKKMPNKVGDGYVIDVEDYKVGCLITSSGYGSRKDPPEMILKNTYKSILNLVSSSIEEDIYIQSPKINAGLFMVLWKDTEEVLIKACETFPKKIIWRVWEL